MLIDLIKRLRGTKIMKIFIPWYFFKIKKIAKNGYYGNGGLNFAWDLGVSFFFFGVSNLQNK